MNCLGNLFGSHIHTDFLKGIIKRKLSYAGGSEYQNERGNNTEKA